MQTTVNRRTVGSNPTTPVGDTAMNQTLPCDFETSLLGGFYCKNL